LEETPAVVKKFLLDSFGFALGGLIVREKGPPEADGLLLLGDLVYYDDVARDEVLAVLASDVKPDLSPDDLRNARALESESEKAC